MLLTNDHRDPRSKQSQNKWDDGRKSDFYGGGWFLWNSHSLGNFRPPNIHRLRLCAAFCTIARSWLDYQSQRHITFTAT